MKFERGAAKSEVSHLVENELLFTVYTYSVFKNVFRTWLVLLYLKTISNTHDRDAMMRLFISGHPKQ